MPGLPRTCTQRIMHQRSINAAHARRLHEHECRAAEERRASADEPAQGEAGCAIENRHYTNRKSDPIGNDSTSDSTD